MEEWKTVLQETCHSLITEKIEDAAVPNSARGEAPKVAVPENTTLSLFLQKNDYCTECSRILSEGNNKKMKRRRNKKNSWKNTCM